MSKVLFDGRRKLAQCPTLIRQGNAVHAVMSLHGGLKDMLGVPLIKSERKEFERLLIKAVTAISEDPQVLAAFQMRLEYSAGQEKELFENVSILLDALEKLSFAEADRAFADLEADKERRFAAGVAALEAGDLDKAREIFTALATEHGSDITLLVNMAEACEKVGFHAKAATLLEKAAKLDPQDGYIHNKLGIVYRRMKNFEQSEQAFNRALALSPDDPNLHFNHGRLYVDWQKWPETLAAARKALEYSPEFNEARMMADYAQKKIG